MERNTVRFFFVKGQTGIMDCVVTCRWRWNGRNGRGSSLFAFFFFFFAGFFSRFVLFFFKKERRSLVFHHSTVRKSKEPEKTKTNENRKVMGRLFGDAVLGRPPWERMDSLYNLFFFYRICIMVPHRSQVHSIFATDWSQVIGQSGSREGVPPSPFAYCLRRRRPCQPPLGATQSNPVKLGKTR